MIRIHELKTRIDPPLQADIVPVSAVARRRRMAFLLPKILPGGFGHHVAWFLFDTAPGVRLVTSIEGFRRELDERAEAGRVPANRASRRNER